MKGFVLFWFWIAAHCSTAEDDLLVLRDGYLQSWSGGICCRQGTNYSLELLMNGDPEAFRITGLRVEDTLIALGPDHLQYRMHGKEQQLHLHFRTQRDQSLHHRRSATLPYRSDPALCFEYNGIADTLHIPRTRLRELPALSYP